VPDSTRNTVVNTGLLLLAFVGTGVLTGQGLNNTATPVQAAEPAVAVVAGKGAVPADAPPAVSWAAGVFGHSGAVRVRMVLPGEAVKLPLAWADARREGVRYRWVPVEETSVRLAGSRGGLIGELGAGDVARAPASAGVYEVELMRGDAATRLSGLRFVVLVPITQKKNGKLNGYRIGNYPGEGTGRTGPYAPPAGFIEVTKANADMKLSEHFRLREFLTHDQASVWPKYAVVDPKLLDKLELVLQDLEANGVPARRMVVMSGYRTPQYNGQGVGRGRASLSRHQYGDAADVWVDNDNDWYMDDLNRDGRRDTRDGQVMLRAVDRIEKRYPDLVGGAGVYRDNGVHGPFIHIDTRGRRARW